MPTSTHHSSSSHEDQLLLPNDHRDQPGSNSSYSLFRAQTRRFLTSKPGHYAVLLLVSLDVSSIFADFVISLYMCEHSKENLNDLERIQEVLGIVGLVFSCLFMAELVASVLAFGWSFFKSKFHVFDATVIIAGFIVDVCLKGIIEEAGSVIIVLRLWRVFKIIEEFSAGAQEQMEKLEGRIEKLQDDKLELLKEIERLKKSGSTKTTR